ncbi:MAG: metallophosphoesterase [Clostridia bacterium]|nr:metallophosphoesterase [Clostridia bacterium]
MKRILKHFVWIFIIFIIFLLICIWSTDNTLKTRTYTLKTSKVTENVRLLIITDLHSTQYGENQSELIEAIDKVNPDVLLLGGDIYDDVRSNDNSRILIKDIVGKYPCYYVSGNHEYWSYEIEQIKSEIRDMGVTVLEGEGESINVNNQSILLCGVDDPDCSKTEYGESKDWYKELSDCNNMVNENQYSILLSHRPERAEDYKNCSFDLILSGHAHGGQFRLPFVINGLYAPHQGFFPKYAGGEYDLGNSKMIVSRGLMITYVPRIFNPPEIVVIDIEG